LADQKLTALTQTTTAGDGDILYVVLDTGGTPVSRKISVKNFQQFLVNTGRTITTAVGLSGGRTLGADITLVADTALLITSGRTITTLVGLSGGNTLAANISLAADTALLVTSGRTITAGAGLTGGGNLSADRTLSLATPVSVSSGGTGATSIGSNQLVIGAGTAAQTVLAALNSGELIVGSATSLKPQILGAGSQGQVLVADSSKTLGMAWVNSSSLGTGGSNVIYAPTGGFYIVFSGMDILTSEKVLTAGTNVTLATDSTAIYINADTGAGGGAPASAEFVTYTANGSLSAEKTLTAGSSINITTDATAIYINATTNAAGASATKTVRIPMALLTVAANTANAWYEVASGASIDVAHVTFVDSGVGVATYWTEVPFNLASAASWNLVFKHEAAAGNGGNVLLTLRASVASNGSTLDASPTVLVSTNAYSVLTNGALNVTTASTPLDSILGISAGHYLRVIVERSGNNASDTVNANWRLKTLNLQCDVN
jgi:hypothetical protein